MKKALLFSLFLLLFSFISHSQIAFWDFDGPTNTGTSSIMGIDNIIASGGSGTARCGSSSGHGISDNGLPTFTFTFTNNSGQNIGVTGLSWSDRASSNGPQNWEVFSDGNSLGTGSTNINSTATSCGGNSVSFSEIIVADGASFSISISFSNNTTNTGTIRVDDVTISGSLLPIELTYLKAKPIDQAVKIMWQTAQEINNNYMVVQRSDDGKRFVEVGRLRGKGNSTESVDYEFIDEQPLPGTNYYRLKQVDYDGAFEYHGPVAVEMEGISEIRISPNPTGDGQVQIALPDLPNATQVDVFDLNGRRLRTLIIDRGIQTTLLSLDNFGAGTYLLRFTNGRTTEQRRLIKL